MHSDAFDLVKIGAGKSVLYFTAILFSNILEFDSH